MISDGLIICKMYRYCHSCHQCLILVALCIFQCPIARYCTSLSKVAVWAWTTKLYYICKLPKMLITRTSLRNRRSVRKLSRVFRTKPSKFFCRYISLFCGARCRLYGMSVWLVSLCDEGYVGWWCCVFPVSPRHYEWLNSLCGWNYLSFAYV